MRPGPVRNAGTFRGSQHVAKDSGQIAKGLYDDVPLNRFHLPLGPGH